jgi:hypothetical protein
MGGSSSRQARWRPRYGGNETIWPDLYASGLTLFTQEVRFADPPYAGPDTMSYGMLKTFGVAPELEQHQPDWNRKAMSG